MHGDVKSLAYVRERATVDDAPVTGHGHEQAARTRDARARAIDEADSQHEIEECGSAAALGGLEEKLSNGDASGGGEEGVNVGEGEEGDNDKEQTTEFLVVSLDISR